MSRVIEFTDGAERGDTSWWTISSGAGINSTDQTHGAYCYEIGNVEILQKTLTTPMSDMYLRFWVKFTAVSSQSVIYLRAGTTALVTLTQDQVLARLNVTGATTGNTGNNSLTFGWQCLEVHFKISDTVGVLTIRLDGTQVFTFTGDTKAGSDSTVDNFYFTASSGSQNLFLDDFALDDTDWCGLGYYLPLTANGAGDVTQWTPTGAANYQNVSIPANDATFNTGTTGQLDNYGMTTTTIGTGAVLRVVPFARANNPAGGTLNIGLKTNGTDYTTTVTTPTSLTWLPGAEYINNPQSGNSWTQAELDALQMTVSVP